MGKKRQKVQWFPVDNLDWANGEEVRKISKKKLYLWKRQTLQNSESDDF